MQRYPYRHSGHAASDRRPGRIPNPRPQAAQSRHAMPGVPDIDRSNRMRAIRDLCAVCLWVLDQPTCGTRSNDPVPQKLVQQDGRTRRHPCSALPLAYRVLAVGRSETQVRRHLSLRETQTAAVGAHFGGAHVRPKLRLVRRSARPTQKAVQPPRPARYEDQLVQSPFLNASTVLDRLWYSESRCRPFHASFSTA